MPRRVARWIRDHPRTVGIVVVASVAIPGFVALDQVQREQGELVECVTSWADEFTARSEYLADPIARREAAEDRIMRAVAMSDEEAFRSALTEYVEAADALDQARTDRPIPEPPRLQCNGR